MQQNLDTLNEEILAYLKEKSFLTFLGFTRGHSQPTAVWDVVHHPDFRPFLDIASQLDVKIVVYNAHQFDRSMVEETIDSIADAELPREEHRTMERRLRELRNYDGFTCAIQLSFDFDGRVFVFDLRTEWYEEFLEILDELDAAEAVGDEDEEQPPMGEFFSKN
jgi:hypothetical protein